MRGHLARIYCHDELKNIGWYKPIAQINQTITKIRGTVRGLHFQNKPNTEMKLVSCLRGAIWDVAVDLRKNSPTFMKWHAEKLSSDNNRALFIPEGFAHGFQSLSEDCELLYLHSMPYARDSESGIRPDDPTLAITWPLEFSQISDRDCKHPLLTPQFNGIEL